MVYGGRRPCLVSASGFGRHHTAGRGAVSGGLGGAACSCSSGCRRGPVGVPSTTFGTSVGSVTTPGPRSSVSRPFCGLAVEGLAACSGPFSMGRGPSRTYGVSSNLCVSWLRLAPVDGT